MMNLLFYKGKFTEVPGSWNDLSPRQYISVIAVLLLQKGTRPQKQIKLLRILSGLSLLRMMAIMGWWRYNPVRFQKLVFPKAAAPALSGVLNRTERLATAAEQLTGFLFAGCDLTRNIIPRIGRFYGPADYLDNLRMGEFVYSENFFNAWKATGDMAALNKLVSILYRPAKLKHLFGGYRYTNDPRINFDPVQCTRYIPVIERWPLARRIAIATMYGSMRQKLIDENPRVFSTPDNTEPTSPYGLWSVMRQVAKEGHFGKFSDIEQSYVATILMELNESLIEAEKQQERLNEITD